MHSILLQPDFAAWRQAAREALQAGYTPEELDLQDAAANPALSLSLQADEPPSGPLYPNPRTSKAFLERAELAAAHRDPARWNLLYRILYRLQTNSSLLNLETDPDIMQFMRLSAQVTRDLNTMQAFVRFHKVLKPGEPSFPDEHARPVVLDEPLLPTDPNQPEPHHLLLATPTPFGVTKTEIEQCEPPSEPIPDEECQHFIAWYEPEQRILPLAAPFFADRFAIMRWTILTPDASVSWNPVNRQLTWGPGVARPSSAPEPEPDELESLWRTYYASLFHHAGPKERLLPTLIMPSKTRAATMVLPQQDKTSAQPFVPEDHSIPSLQAAMPSCRGCDLYCHATQAVPGRGNNQARVMLVGEQPGDQEDLQGLPFVGPAGKTLDRALHELNLDRSKFFLTNAVKHFKFVQRGRLRLHTNPRMSEILACRPWLLAEIESVRPRVILCLGASASKSLLGSSFALMRERGKLLETPFAKQVMATVHPSAILRARDDASRHQLFSYLKDDLARAYEIASA